MPALANHILYASIYVSDNILKPALVSKSESTVLLSNSIARTGVFKFASTRHKLGTHVTSEFTMSGITRIISL